MSEQNTAEHKSDEAEFGAIMNSDPDYIDAGANNATVDLGGEGFVASQSECPSQQQTPRQRKRDAKSQQKAHPAQFVKKATALIKRELQEEEDSCEVTITKTSSERVTITLTRLNSSISTQQIPYEICYPEDAQTVSQLYQHMKDRKNCRFPLYVARFNADSQVEQALIPLTNASSLSLLINAGYRFFVYESVALDDDKFKQFAHQMNFQPCSGLQERVSQTKRGGSHAKMIKSETGAVKSDSVLHKRLLRDIEMYRDSELDNPYSSLGTIKKLVGTVAEHVLTQLAGGAKPVSTWLKHDLTFPKTRNMLKPDLCLMRRKTKQETVNANYTEYPLVVFFCKTQTKYHSKLDSLLAKDLSKLFKTLREISKLYRVH